MTQIQGNGIGHGLKLGKSQMEMAESYMTTADMLARQNGKTKGVTADSDAFDVAKNIRYDKTNKPSAPDTVMNNFNEYMKDMQDKAKAEGEDQTSEEHERNEAAREVARNISSEERQLLEQMGVDVDSTDLSDLMNLVNNLRSEAHKEELNTLLAMAKVNQGDFDNLMITGAGVSVAGTDVKLQNVDVMTVAKEQKEVQEANVQHTSNTSGVTQDNIQISNAEYLYLQKNHLPVNQENLYKAHFSGQKAEEGNVSADMEAQLLKVCEQAGFAGDESALEGAKLLLSNDVPVTTDAIRGYMDFKKFVGMDIQEIPTEKEQLQLEETSKDNLGERLYQETKQVSTLAVFDMVQEGRAVTIASARTYTESHLDRYADDAYVSERMEDIAALKAQITSLDGNVVGTEMAMNSAALTKDLSAVTAMRQMEEIRLSMTASVATRMMKIDINIDTRELSQVVADLKMVERQMTLDAFKQKGVAPTEENLNLYQEMQQKVQEIGNAPAYNLGLLMGETSFTVRAFHSAITMAGTIGENAETEAANQTTATAVSATGFEAIRRSYEAVGTAPRADMGDSIKKAFSNAGDMLGEMNLPVTEENLRAVRILGYNSIEITETNISEIVNYDRQVNDMMDAFYPEAVLSMIKDGINPLDMEISELTATIRGKNYNQGVSEAKNFATYLRDMEKQGELTKEQRESYIGMFRMMDKLAKSGDREAGFLFANGSRLTVRNLLTAMRSRRDAGLDVSIDDNFGMLQGVETSGRAIDTQIASAFSQGNAYEDALSDENVAAYMEEMQIPMTAVNAQAVSMMVSENASFYDMVSDVMSKLHFEDHTTEDAVDEETGRMSASMSGAEIGVDFSLDDAVSHLLEQLRGSDEMALTYENLRDQLTERIYLGGLEGTISSEDLASIKLVQAGFNVMSRMARQDHYHLPVQTEQGVQVVNLTIQHGDEKGVMEIRMHHENIGNIQAKFAFSDDNILQGFVVADTSEGNMLLAERQEYFQMAMAENGYENGAFSLGQMMQGVSGTSYQDGISPGRIYESAVSCVKILANL